MRILITFIIALLGLYPVAGEVVECDNGIAVIETADGNLWEYYDDIPEGQEVLMLMHNNGTPCIEDDTILRIWRKF